MPVNTGQFGDHNRLSRFLPTTPMTTTARRAAHGWELAAVGYAVTIWLYVIGELIVSLAYLPGGFRVDLQVVFSRQLLIAAPATLTVITLATRRPPSDEQGRWLLDAALTLCVPLGVLFAIAGFIGFFAAFGDFSDSVSGAFYDLLIHAGGVVLGTVTARWALRELSNLDADAAPAPEAA